MHKDLTLAFSKQQCIKGPRGFSRFLENKNHMILFDASAGYYVFRHPSNPGFDVFIRSNAFEMFEMNSFLAELSQKLPTLQAFPGSVWSVPVEEHQSIISFTSR